MAARTMAAEPYTEVGTRAAIRLVDRMDGPDLLRATIERACRERGTSSAVGPLP